METLAAFVCSEKGNQGSYGPFPDVSMLFRPESPLILILERYPCYKHTHTHTHLYMHTHTRMHTQVYTHTLTRIHTYSQARIHTH